MTAIRRFYTRKGTKFSGALIVGDTDVEIPPSAKFGEHMSRAFYLTACLEAPRWGTVQSYDGCGMSGGPMHWVAVLPQGLQQGPLFKLLRRLEMQGTEEDTLEALWEALQVVGWYVACDGVLRDLKTGASIKGAAILEEFTPNKGNPAAKQWDQTVRWAEFFHALLSDPWTFDIQQDHSIEYLVSGARAEELQAYRYFLPELQTPETLSLSGKGLPVISLKVDFAMCVYHSFSPNAPGMAKVVLGRFFKSYEAWLAKQANTRFIGRPEARNVNAVIFQKSKVVAEHDPEGDYFARLLIKKLGTTQYGNWHDRPHQSGARYDRCRKYARESGLWPETYFEDNGLMPEDLKG